NSGNCGAVFTDKSGKTFRITSSYMDPKRVAGQKSDDGHVYVGGFTARMDPDGSNVEIIGHNYRNCYEQVVTSFGDVFQSDNDDPPACRVSHVIEYGNAGFSSRDGKRNWRAGQRRGQDTPTAEWRQDDPGTMPAGDVYGGGSPTGVAFYENGALGKKWRGLLLTCEPARNVVFGYQPVRDGAGFKLERMDWMTCNPEHKFNGGDFSGRWDGKLNTQFRPSDVTVGVDGAIYVADWFDGRVGGHQTLDNSLSGTIYRIAPKGFVSKVPEMDLETVDGQITALCSPAVNVRQLGRDRLRVARGKAVAAIDALYHGETPKHDNPFLQARALWLSISPQWTGKAHARSLDPDLELVQLRALLRQNAILTDAMFSASPNPSTLAAYATSLRDVTARDSVAALTSIGSEF
ncbi:MAG TPA: dehydrogenase, partial [Planctomycetes bacterium]|nr:dehydrogenase [Planctomycetota bacterium]